MVAEPTTSAVPDSSCTGQVLEQRTRLASASRVRSECSYSTHASIEQSPILHR